MDSPACLLLVLALTIGCALGQRDLSRTQPISSSTSGSPSLKNYRNPQTTTASISSQTPTLTATSQPPIITALASERVPIVAPSSRQQSQILTPLRNKTISVTTTTTTSAPTTTTVSSPADSAVNDAAAADDGVDPTAEDLCINSLQIDAFKVGQEFPIDGCRKKCKCVFRDEPKDAFKFEMSYATENWRVNSSKTELRCSVPEFCPDISEKLSGNKCPQPTASLPSSFESCDCPEIECASPVTPDLYSQPELPATTSRISPQRLFPSTLTTSAVSVATQEPKEELTSTTTTSPRPTQASTVATIVKTTPTTPSIPKQQTTRLITPVITTTVPTTTTTSQTKTSTTSDAVTTTVSSASPPTERSRQQQQPTGEGPRMAPSSIIQVLDGPLEKYAAHLLIALAVMTGLFVYMCYLYMRRAFRSSMVRITDYDNLAFSKRVFIDETDQNFRNKNKEVDGFSPKLII